MSEQGSVYSYKLGSDIMCLITSVLAQRRYERIM